MDITFDLPHVFEADSDPLDNAAVLVALLDCQIAIDIAYLKRHSTPRLYMAGVVYGRTRRWLPIPAVLARGYADCKSLAPWFIAERRIQGLDAEPTFRWFRRADGKRDFHILVQTSENVFEDPSRVLGMGRE